MPTSRLPWTRRTSINPRGTGKFSEIRMVLLVKIDIRSSDKNGERFDVGHYKRNWSWRGILFKQAGHISTDCSVDQFQHMSVYSPWTRNKHIIEVCPAVVRDSNHYLYQRKRRPQIEYLAKKRKCHITKTDNLSCVLRSWLGCGTI